jgi:membrane protein implicated in regulation of membrane protease activity
MKNFLAIFAPALAVVAIGVTAAMHGEADDAPGLALLGILLIVGALAWAVRTAQRRSQHPGAPLAGEASPTGKQTTG